MATSIFFLILDYIYHIIEIPDWNYIWVDICSVIFYWSRCKGLELSSHIHLIIRAFPKFGGSVKCQLVQWRNMIQYQYVWCVYVLCVCVLWCVYVSNKFRLNLFSNRVNVGSLQLLVSVIHAESICICFQPIVHTHLLGCCTVDVWSIPHCPLYGQWYGWANCCGRG